MGIKAVEDAVSSCRTCLFVDKPFIKYGVYRERVPVETRVLVVSESPPPGYKEDYLYNIGCRDRLRIVLAKALGVREDEVLSYLYDNGIFWTTAVKCRPESKRNLEFMRKNCVRMLKLEIEVLKPKVILCLGEVAWRSISELINVIDAGVIVKWHHPLYIARFRRQSLSLLGRLISRLPRTQSF